MCGNIIGRLAIERSFSRQQLIQHDSKRVDIRPLIDHIALQLFWRHIFGCSPGLLRDASSASYLTCETEVSKLRVALGVEKNVSGLHISMDQAMTVSGLPTFVFAALRTASAASRSATAAGDSGSDTTIGTPIVSATS